MDDRFDISTVHAPDTPLTAFKYEVNIARNFLGAYRANSRGLQRENKFIPAQIFDCIGRCLKYLTQLIDRSQNTAIEVGAE